MLLRRRLSRNGPRAVAGNRPTRPDDGRAERERKMMLDKNGVEIRTGCIVEITGAYFKNDNGLYFVQRSPGDPSWCGRDYSLKKISKAGKISKAKYSLCFWPIVSVVSDRWKTAEANAWNRPTPKLRYLQLRTWARSLLTSRPRLMPSMIESAGWSITLVRTTRRWPSSRPCKLIMRPSQSPL